MDALGAGVDHGFADLDRGVGPVLADFENVELQSANAGLEGLGVMGGDGGAADHVA